MPKSSLYALLWSEEYQQYELHLRGQLHHYEPNWIYVSCGIASCSNRDWIFTRDGTRGRIFSRKISRKEGDPQSASRSIGVLNTISTLPTRCERTHDRAFQPLLGFRALRLRRQ